MFSGIMRDRIQERNHLGRERIRLEIPLRVWQYVSYLQYLLLYVASLCAEKPTC